MADERASVVKELAGAASAQSQVANRYWIALITVSLVATLSSRHGSTMPLPFGLGPIDPSSFYLAMFALLVVLMIAFASAHAQQVRVQRMAHRGLDQLGDEPVLGIGLHPRDLFDALRLPSVNRLAPLAQLFRGRDSFFGSPGNVAPWRKRTSAVYYVLLKMASWFVYFGFPGAALWLTLARVQATWWLSLVLLSAAVISTLSLVHVLAVDIWYLREVQGIIVESKVPSNRALEPTAR